MLTTVRYNPMQQSQPQRQQQQQQQQQQSNGYNYQQHHHPHHQYQESHQQSPIPQIQNVVSNSNQRLNNNNNNNNYHHHHPQTQLTIQTSPPIDQSAAYFLDRIDLENYTANTLKRTVENILSKTKSKGLKVKISLPDSGLVINNITDPNQSWIFKTSELLYFWRDPYYLNVVIVVTTNRSRHHTNRPYSASIFRLRGTDSAKTFLQRAQQIFTKLSTSASMANTPKNSIVEKSIRTENRVTDRKHSIADNKRKMRPISTISEQFASITPKNRHRSPQSTTPIRLVTRAEFDTGKTTTNSTVNPYNRRTYSGTSSSDDSQTTSSTKEVLSSTKKSNNYYRNDDNDDDKITPVSKNLSSEHIAELMRELKELRNEIAALKLEKIITPLIQSISTNPLAIYYDNSKQKMESSTTTTTSSPSVLEMTSQSEVDVETQTDFSLISHKRRPLSRKNKKTMIGSGGLSALTKKQSPQSNTGNSKRTFSNSSTTTVSDKEETTERSSQVTDSSNDTNSLLKEEYYQPKILAAPPRPTIVRKQNGFRLSKTSTSNNGQMVSNSNFNEEGSFVQGMSMTGEKEMSKFLSTNSPSLNSEGIGPPVLTGGTANFRSSLDNSNPPTEHIYENVPILIQANSNRGSYYNIPIINGDDQHQEQTQSNGYPHHRVNNDHESESQQQVVLSYPLQNSSAPTENNSSEIQLPSLNIPHPKPQIVSAGRHRSQPIYFANHLTNPVFNVDRQLLINTIANQFGVDLNSPQLQQLLSNQHLFAARKRTFANMVWQLTPDEETAICSSPITTQMDIIDIDSVDTHNSRARSILKATKRFRSTSKRRGIKWDSALE